MAIDFYLALLHVAPLNASKPHNRSAACMIRFATVTRHLTVEWRGQRWEFPVQKNLAILLFFMPSDWHRSHRTGGQLSEIYRIQTPQL